MSAFQRVGQRARNLAPSNVATNLATCLALTALNLSISWRLLKIEYTGHFSSVEGYFIAYKDIRVPERFDGVLPLLHRENGDSIYSVLPLGASLAHVMKGSDLVPHHARGNFAYADIRKYALATVDAARPAATFEWRGGGRARIRADLRPEDAVSVQVAWFPGWKAFVRGEQVPVNPDGMGFIVIQPRCQGECEIDLAWTGRGDRPLSAAVSLATLGLLGFLSFRVGRAIVPGTSACATSADEL